MKKIIFYTMTLARGGTEQTVVNLANEFIKTYDITIITNINSKPEYKLNKKIKHICLDKDNKQNEKGLKKIKTKLSLARSKRLKEVIKEESPNLIFTFLPEPTIRGLSLKKSFNIPILVAIRNHPQKEFRFLKIIRNYFYQKADGFIIQDKSYAKYLKRISSNKIYLIPNFLSEDFENYEHLEKRENKIVSVGRLEKQKNFQLLIKAFSKLPKDYNHYKLEIYGKGSQKVKLQKLINSLKLEDRVILKGNTNNVRSHICKAQVFVLPSNYEGMPNALIEAMSLALPVISTNSSKAIGTIIENGKNGLIIPKNNVKELEKALRKVLENASLRKSLAKEAAKVKNIYAKKKIIQKWEFLIKTFGR